MALTSWMLKRHPKPIPLLIKEKIWPKKEKGKPVFDYEACVACTSCVQSCPFDCIEMTKFGVDKRYKIKPYPNLEIVETCNGCKLCEKQCPVECISIQLAA